MGTFVEIQLKSQLSATHAQNLMTEALNQMESQADLLSYYNPESELTRLNSIPVGSWTCIGKAMQEVLQCALDLQRTAKVFNVAVANPLKRWGYLPGRLCKNSWSDLEEEGFELGPRSARRVLPVSIDLGGIAKGYLVDRAVNFLLKEDPSSSGSVNAGGDLRVFGEDSSEVWVRTWEKEQFVFRPVVLKNRAMATSSAIPLRGYTPYVDISGRDSLSKVKNATALAPTCMLADAGTKIALLADENTRESIRQKFLVETVVAA